MKQLLFDDSFQKDARLQLARTHLQKIQVCVDHGVAEIALNVRHCLTLNLKSIAHPQSV